MEISYWVDEGNELRFGGAEVRASVMRGGTGV
jgi:hypothetical protein